MEVRLNRFKQFESNNNELSNDELKELFYDLLDDGYEIEFFKMRNDSSHDYHSFSLKKKYTGSEFGYVMKYDIWGCSDVKAMNDELTKIFSILNEAKERLDEFGYIIYFEPEFNFSDECYFNITCRAQHKDFIKDWNG